MKNYQIKKAIINKTLMNLLIDFIN